MRFSSKKFRKITHQLIPNNPCKDIIERALACASPRIGTNGQKLIPNVVDTRERHSPGELVVGQNEKSETTLVHLVVKDLTGSGKIVRGRSTWKEEKEMTLNREVGWDWRKKGFRRSIKKILTFRMCTTFYAVAVGSS